LKTAAQKKAHLAKLAEMRKPRPAVCTICGKAIMIRTNGRKLCLKHKDEDDRRKRNKREKNVEARSVLHSVPKTDRDPIVEGPGPALRLPPPLVRRGESDETNETVETRQDRSTSDRPRTRTGGFEDAIRLITVSESRREGWRHGFIGNTGTGKTTATRAFIDAHRAFTLIHDDAKLDAQYPGTVVRKFEDAPEDANTITLRGDAFAGTVVEVEDVAELGISIARATREPVRLVVDELDRACTRGGRELASPSLRVAFTQGRALGVSVLWSTQTPQRAPIEVVDQSSTIGIFQLGPRALNYLDERLCFDAELLAVVPTLNVGEFVIYEQGRPWNRITYRAPGP
jgi:hypothetical protein